MAPAPGTTRALRRYAVPAAALLLGPLLALTACADDGPDTSPSPGRSSGAVRSTTPQASPTPSTPAATRSGDGSQQGGTAADPAALAARKAPLDWKPVPGSTKDTVTRAGRWTLTVDEAGTHASIEGPGAGEGVAAGPRERISDTLIDGRYAVVVLQDRQETRPSRAHVLDLRSGDSFDVDGGSDVPTTNGGTWALGEGTLLHATVHQGSYCTAMVDLATRRSTLGWCAPKRHGFSEARITPAGTSLLTFDDSRPACRTIVALHGRDVTPFHGVPDCKGWEGLVTADGAVWSVVPNEHRVEAAHAYARSRDAWFDLGPSDSGSLVWCGGAAYFTRSPQRDRDPAQLLRWSPDDGLGVAYQTSGGHAFLAEPRCGGDTMTITVLAQGGDQQVSAALG